MYSTPTRSQWSAARSRTSERDREAVHREISSEEILFECAGPDDGQGSGMLVRLCASRREIHHRTLDLDADGSEALVCDRSRTARHCRASEFRGPRPVLPLDDQAFQEIKKAMGRRKTGPVFMNPKTRKRYFNIRKALLKAAEEAKIKKPVNHHMLRHSIATHLVDQEEDFPEYDTETVDQFGDSVESVHIPGTENGVDLQGQVKFTRPASPHERSIE